MGSFSSAASPTLRIWERWGIDRNWKSAGNIEVYGSFPPDPSRIILTDLLWVSGTFFPDCWLLVWFCFVSGRRDAPVETGPAEIRNKTTTTNQSRFDSPSRNIRERSDATSPASGATPMGNIYRNSAVKWNRQTSQHGTFRNRIEISFSLSLSFYPPSHSNDASDRQRFPSRIFRDSRNLRCLRTERVSINLPHSGKKIPENPEKSRENPWHSLKRISKNPARSQWSQTRRRNSQWINI